VTDFLSDMVDDVKDFVDDDILDRTRGVERDVRRAGRNWTDSDDDGAVRTDADRADAVRSAEGSRTTGSASDEIDELRQAIRALAEKINGLSGAGAVSDMPITGYDDLTAVEISTRLTSLSQADLKKVDAYERRHANRSTVLSRIAMLKNES